MKQEDQDVVLRACGASSLREMKQEDQDVVLRACGASSLREMKQEDQDVVLRACGASSLREMKQEDQDVVLRACGASSLREMKQEDQDVVLLACGASSLREMKQEDQDVVLRACGASSLREMKQEDQDVVLRACGASSLREMKQEDQDVVLRACGASSLREMKQEDQDVVLRACGASSLREMKQEDQDVVLRACGASSLREMKQEDQDVVLRACGASSLRVGAVIQTLWSGYGELLRLHLRGCERLSAVVKHVKFPGEAEHHQPGPPVGRNTDRSHRRKVRSYQVETHWYRNYSTSPRCRIPACLAACSHGDEMLIVLEDLDAAGFDQRRTKVKDREIRACLSWLAHFHALFLGVAPEGLWPVGTYWHLETRPDELEAMDDQQLKAAAGDIDRMLDGCRFKTIVHGDAKLANFCFSRSGTDVAAVDFQYVGGGCGMKDVAYLLTDCLEGSACEKRVPGLLDYYFSELKLGVKKDVDFAALEKEWREMFAFAWTDFHRFLLGWMPGHWKINRYSKQLTKEVLHKLKL